MRTLFPILLSGLLIVLIGCDEETNDTLPPHPRAVIQFQNEQLVLTEGGNDAIVSLLLNQAAVIDGTIVLKIDEAMQQRVQTSPTHVAGVLTLPVTKGASQLQFRVKALNNTLVEGDQTITFSIEESASFTLGEQKTFQLVIEEDDAVQSTVNFAEQQIVMSEQGEPVAYKILFTPAVAAESKITIAISANKVATFTTSPASENNRLTLSAPVGTTELSFVMQTIDNTEFDGNTEVEFSIASTEGPVVKGTQIKQKVTISDDELTGKLKGYELITSESTEKRTYEYDLKGRISKVITESYAPHNPTTQTDTYFYDEQDRLVKINKWLGRDVIYTWSNNRIEHANVYQDDVLMQYANYAYDDLGNLAGIEPFYKKSDGTFVAGEITIYLYFTDGNLYKSLTYNSAPNNDVLWLTRTYDQYVDVEAPISMFEVLPNMKVQKNLAGSYRFENHATGQDMMYTITYEFRPDGQPSKRTASAPGDTQVAVYHYY